MRSSILISFLFAIIECWTMTPYKTYSVADGLPNSTVKAICQDSLGYMYFGTRNGLARFDGYEFRNYNYSNQKENMVYNNDITCLTKDKKGLIWIGTFNWITLFDPFSEEFVELDLQYPDNGSVPKGVVTGIFIDEGNRIWISLKTGLYVLDGKKVNLVKALKGAAINSMGSCDKENLLLEIMGKGLALFNIHSQELRYVDESQIGKRPMAYKIFRDSKEKVWVGAESNSLFLYQPDKEALVLTRTGINKEIGYENDQIHDIIEYNDSIILLGTDNGLLAVNSITNSYYKNISDILPVNRLHGSRIMSLNKDKQGALWVGTFNKGVRYCNPDRYYFNYLQSGVRKMPGNIIGNLIESDGSLLIGHEQGISVMDMKTGDVSVIDFPQLNARHAKTELFFMYQGLPHVSYVHFLNKGTFLFHTDNLSVGKNIGIPSTSQVRSMMKDKNGNIWMAEEELSVFNPLTGEVNANLSTNFNNVTNFMLTQDLLLRYNGNMLVGTRTNGIWEYAYDELTGKYLNGEKLDIEPLKDKNINVLFEDSKYNVWAGTYGSGLYQYNPEEKKYKLFNVDNGLVHNSICGILEDDDNGDIWVATLNGLSKIEYGTERIINYTVKTGFPLEEVSRKAFLKGSNGLFYVGGSNGLASFNPKLFKEKRIDSPIVKISLVKSLNTTDNKERNRFDDFNSLQQIEFPFNHSSIIVKFSTLNYFFPLGNRYAYKLIGLDEDWKYTERNEAVYTNLSEGNYVFAIKASDNEGVWSDKVTEISIVIHPPLWRTVWAKLLYVLLFSVLLYFIAQYFYNKKTLKYKQQISRIEKENIEQYYQMKLELFTKFSHELRTPLSLITGPTEDILNSKSLPENLLAPVRLIHKNANRLLLLVNQLMDFRKIEHGSMILKVRKINIDSFLTEQIDNFTALAGKKNIGLTFQNQYWGRDVWFDSEMMEKVIFNLISNAIKYTNAEGEIIIASKEKEGHLLISVKDNGEGIPPEYQEKIFNPFFQVHPRSNPKVFGSGIGLNFAKYIVNLHGGEIWVSSEHGGGAEFFVRIPLGVDHFDPTHTEIEEFVNEELSDSGLARNKDLSVNSEECTEHHTENMTWILVIEDDDDLRQYIVSLLSEEYLVMEASDGKMALSLAIDKMPDLIISDIMMPQMSGIELCNLVKEDIRTAHIPVILLTAKAMREHIQEGYEALADDYILKPFDSKLLKVRVRNLIDNRIQLRKVFSNQLTTLDVSTVELSSNDQFMEKMIEVIKSRIDDSNLSINDLSQEMGVSRAQLFRKIKAISDLSPNKLILNIRIKMAVDYLKKNQYTISEVAYKTGFSDPAYFSKIFKGIFNITPSDYVKTHLDCNE